MDGHSIAKARREDKQASADTFFDDGLKWFGYKSEPIKSPWDKGKQLADLIRQNPTLLILDGLEPLQYPPGTMQGELRDQGMKALLKELSRMNNGLCVISTRCEVKDIEHTVANTTNRIHLENLSDEAGIQLLKHLDVKGTEKELRETSQDFSGHALALNLLGSYLATVHDGEIRKRDLIPRLTEDEEQGGHTKRVLESYEIWLKDKPELEILYMMGLFDRPAPKGAIDTLRKPPPIEGFTDALESITQAKWKFALKHLRELHLLAKKDPNEPDTLDCHPLIREHFGEKLKAKGEKHWQEAHSRLYEYYKNFAKEYPDTLQEMEPLFAAVVHGCQAGKHQEALDKLYFERIERGNDKYCTFKLGAIGAVIASLSNFFDIP